MALKFFFFLIAALLAGSFVDYARADEAYVCDEGVVVMVMSGDLERQKRENPCVASHYGLTAVAPAAVPLPAPHPSRRAELKIARTAASHAVTLRTSIPDAAHALSRVQTFAAGPIRVINAAAERPTDPKGTK